jgi:hypothetical protein
MIAERYRYSDGVWQIIGTKVLLGMQGASCGIDF